MPIGLAAFTRKFQGKPDLQLLEDNVQDNSIQTQVKSIVQGMTQVSPEERLPASSVEHMLMNLLLETSHYVSMLSIFLSVTSEEAN